MDPPRCRVLISPLGSSEPRVPSSMLFPCGSHTRGSSDDDDRTSPLECLMGEERLMQYTGRECDVEGRHRGRIIVGLET